MNPHYKIEPIVIINEARCNHWDGVRNGVVSKFCYEQPTNWRMLHVDNELVAVRGYCDFHHNRLPTTQWKKTTLEEIKVLLIMEG
jgi:hypothetical protein